MKLAKTLNTKALQRRVLQYTVQEMHAGLISILVSKRLDRWRRDISENRRKCKKHSSETFSFKTSAQEDGKLKCSTSFLHIFSTFSSNFLQIFQMSRTQTVSITGRRMFASTLGRARLFTPMKSSCAKIHESVARLLRQPKKRLRLCGAQTHLFSVATEVYDAKCVFCSYPRKKCHSNPKGTPLVKRFLLGQLETNGWPALRTLHCASWFYTRRGRKLIL